MTPYLLQYPNGIFLTTRHITLDAALAQMSISDTPIIRMHQTHSANVSIIDTPVQPKSTLWIDDTDAIISNQPAILLIKTADCLPVIITHPSGWKAAIHAGRRGTESEITMKTAAMLIEASGYADGYQAWFGPRICESCYQIDPVGDVHFDLVSHNKIQLLSVLGDGVTILDTDYCTVCSNDIFFSYRKEATAERIFSGVI
jgi:polyphenol oxidase